MRFYTPYVRRKQKGDTINFSYQHATVAIILLFISSFAASDTQPQWDCKLANDGQTWDCSTSTKPRNVTAKVPVAPAKNTAAQTAQTAQTSINSAVPPVRQEAPLSVATTEKRSQQKITLKNPATWNCQAGTDGDWDCTKTSKPNHIELATSSEPSTPPATSSTDPRVSEALFHQMVAQLASDPWDNCELVEEKPIVDTQETTQARLNASTDIQANYAELADENTAEFSGDVSINRADQRITADHLTYQNKTAVANMSGDVFYQQHDLALYSQQANLNLDQDTGKFSHNQFIIESSHARAQTTLTEQVNSNITRSSGVEYTTCAPGDNAWSLKAKTLELNKETGRGTGRDVWVDVFSLPILYTPYISFPIDDRRQSGILTPTFGVSDTTGLDISVPYYWNIAPNYDATLTPRVMSDRGLMLGGEFRYLSTQSEGQVFVEILDDTETSELRGQFSYQDNTRFNSRLSSSLDLNYISDDEYFEDFGDSLSSASGRYLKSNAQLNYRADNWNLLTKIENYDSIDADASSASRPHRLLPQVLFNLKETDAFGLAKVNMRNEFVFFDHSHDAKAKRLDLHPSISLPFRTPGSFITPKLGVRYTDYTLSNQADGIDSHQNRTLPILSVDSGLFFERELNIGGGVIQTLEPRAFYLYVPHENQDEIPLFDTSEYDFSFNQLFRENRFAGADRVGDANQLTLALTTRFIDSNTGSEQLKASLGTIIYFDDLEVGLSPNSKPITKDSSDIVGELSAKLTEHWAARSALQYDPHTEKTQKATVGLHYRNGDNRLFNATYRSRYEGTLDSNGNSNDLEQTDLSFKWPLSKSWNSVGRWNYSAEHDLSLDTFLGLEKDTCCWRFRVIARRYVNNEFDEEPTEGLFFQFELKGLTSFGDKLDSLLEEGILGYQIPER